MEQISEQITKELLQELPDQVHFFTPDELLTSGFPYIVVETLRKNVESTIDSELSMPESKWIQTDDGNVRQAWQNFVEVSRQYLRIPASKLPYMLAEVVEQCLELALKPRKAVPEIIFRTLDSIDFETAKVRVESLEVNKQLGLALLRYMEKKEKDEITIDQARELIKKIDRRLVENYHPLNWAQALKPVFDIAGPSVDTDLFQIFFDDKEKPGYARKLGQLKENLNETELVEVLSSAGLLDFEEEEGEQPEFFVPDEGESEPEKIVEIEKAAGEKKLITAEKEEEGEESDEKDHQEIEVESSEDFDEPKEKPVEPPQPEEKREFVAEAPPDAEDIDSTEDEEEEQEENIVDLFSQIREDDLFEEEQDEQVLSLVERNDDQDIEDDNISLLSKFKFDDSGEDLLQDAQDESETSESSGKEEPSSIYDEMNLVKDDLTDIQKNKNFIENSPEESDENEEEFTFKIENREEEESEAGQEDSTETDPVVVASDDVDEDEDEEEQPMWRSFLERDDIETESGYEYDEDPDDEITDEFEEEEDDDFIEEPIYDLTTNDQDPDEKIKKISGWLDDEKDRFVNEIFTGSDVAYEQALLEIMDFQNWKAASMYLEKEVFSRNKVDVYDEVAVDFTDRLHSFFLEIKSNQDN